MLHYPLGGFSGKQNVLFVRDVVLKMEKKKMECSTFPNVVLRSANGVKSPAGVKGHAHSAVIYSCGRLQRNISFFFII